MGHADVMHIGNRYSYSEIHLPVYRVFSIRRPLRSAKTGPYIDPVFKRGRRLIRAKRLY